MKFINKLDYQNVDNCIDTLKNNNFEELINCDEFKINGVFTEDNKVIFHVYWYGSISRKQIASINSYLKTQNLKNTELWVWLDNSCFTSECNKIPKHNNIKTISYHANDISKDTPFYNKEFINNKSFVKFRSDMARLMILFKFGGLYIDLDIFLLKDFTHLFGIEFCYSWSNLKQGNNAILRFSKQSNRLLKLMNRYIDFLSRYAEDFKFNVGMTHNDIFNDSLDLLCLPSTLFDPVWVLFDTKSKSNYSNLTNFDDFFCKTDEDITNFFDNQIYAYHWHSRNNFIIEKDSYFEKLESL